MRRPFFLRLALTAISSCALAALAWACANWYSSSILQEGDAAFSARPATRFASAVEKLASSSDLKAVNADDGWTESATACVTLLHRALFLDQKPADPAAAEKSLRAFADWRAALLTPPTDTYRYRPCATFYQPEIAHLGTANFSVNWASAPQEIVPPALDSLALPEEFSLYLVGAIAWSKNDYSAAQTAWEKLLALPEESRRYQGTFAAFMLGKLALKDPRIESLPKARSFFQQTRQIAQDTGIDPCGLSAASLGEEARTYLLDGPSVADLSSAAQLYLQQAATGDHSATPSLQHVLRLLTRRSDEALQQAAQDDTLRSLYSAYLTADGGRWGEKPADREVRRWIRILEASDAATPQDALRLALLCYQQGEYFSCSRWLHKAPADAPLNHWLMARLLIREGKTTEAAALLARTIRTLNLGDKLQNLSPDSYEPVSPWRYEEELLFGDDDLALASRIVAEHGLLAMSAKDFTAALDDFLRSQLDEDAAYVAEYVLKTDELKSYVDTRWPTGTTASAGLQIRHLLAKRLLREQRTQDARDYFPEAIREIFDQYVTHSRQAYDLTQSAEVRAAGFWKAAVLVRENGEALFFAEAGPTWSTYGGWSDSVRPQTARRDEGKNPFTTASYEEISRVESATISKEDRDRRYRAAILASYAAALLPNNDDRTARILATAGAWLKYREPRAAEPFYKLLVIRCPETELGKSAARLHWFPPEITGATQGVWDDVPGTEDVSSEQNSSEQSTPEENVSTAAR